MNARFKVFASYNILQYLCDFVHVLIFVNVSKCQKSPKLTKIVILDDTFCAMYDNIGTMIVIRLMLARLVIKWLAHAR